ncbi:MAG: 1-acyl-sn-glycerol-3-phosphate acyltransferase [Actinomycetia bacterium]|nr:1-acyl-sn-glycerol-3-phosphate acyltransferase [Actinomycetes bacterium]
MADNPDGAEDFPYGRYQHLAKKVIAPVFRLCWKLEVTGIENVPSAGPAVLCPNHLAAIDSFMLPAVLDRRVIYVGKAEYLDDWKTRWLFPAMGMIPIDRRGGDHAAAALDAAGQVLVEGGLFGIYPEGTRSRTGKLYKGHTGAARLAVDNGAPIIPVGLVGTDDIQPVDVSMPRLFKTVEVKVGRPIPVERYRQRIGDHVLYRELIDEVMFEIQAMTGQEYVSIYAKDAQAAAEAEKAVPTPSVPRRSSADVLVSKPLVMAS